MDNWSKSWTITKRDSPVLTQIIFLNGPSSAGKTTLAKQLQKVLPSPFLHIGIDKMISMMPEHLNDWVGGYAPLGFSWKQAQDASGAIMQEIQMGPFAYMINEGLREMAFALADLGHHLIIDEVVPAEELDAWKQRLHPFGVLYVGLTAPVEVLEERERVRQGRIKGCARHQFHTVHLNATYDLYLDSSQHPPEALAKMIQERLENPMPLRETIYKLIEQISPSDELERKHLKDALAWVASGVEIFRIAKPSHPKKHLVSYFAVIDEKERKILLVDHKKAGMWLPGGGHVEPMEHPTDTVKREVQEELFFEADFLLPLPLFLTVQTTAGKTGQHTDVSLWYVLRGDSSQPPSYDSAEFHGAQWFSFDQIPIGRSEPHLSRFLTKLEKATLQKAKE